MGESLWSFYPEKVIAVQSITFGLTLLGKIMLALKSNASVLIFANEIQMLSNSSSSVGFGLDLHGSPIFSHFIQVVKIIGQIEKQIDWQTF